MPVIAFDVGGTKLLGGVFSEDLTCELEIRRPVSAGGVRDRVRMLCEMARELQASDPDACAIGVAFPARVISDRGLAQERGGEWVDVAGLVAEQTGLVASVDNDACAALLAELCGGAAHGCESTLLLTVGTDLGGAVSIGGSLRRGRTGLAGEIHGMLLSQGDGDAPLRWGDWVNGERLGDEAAVMAGAGYKGGLHDALAAGEKIDGRLVTELALQGDACARALVGEFGRRLAVGVANVVRVFEPELILVGGGVSRAGDLLLEPLRVALRRELPPGSEVRVSAAQLGERASLVGAAIIARDSARQRAKPPGLAGP